MASSPAAIALALADAARDAWQEVGRRPDRHDRLGVGAGGNVTTKADDRLERAVLAAAREHGVSVLSEEAGFVDNGSDLLAVVDPLDGSRNAGRGIPFHCTSVAVGPGKAGLAGLRAAAVRNLVTDDLYTAAKGKGARENGVPVPRRAFDPSEVLIGLIADYTTTEIDEAHQRPQHHIRDLGSAALELCLVGTGGLDAFLVRKPWLRVVDIAAATLFVKEAGGLVKDPATGADLQMPFDMAARNGVLAAHNAQALQSVGLTHALSAGAPTPLPTPSRPRSRRKARRLTWALVGKADIPHVRKAALWLRDHLQGLGQGVLLETDLGRADGGKGLSLAELDRKADLFLTVGGDGTILMTLNATEKPVLGVNAGAIGFLAEVEPPLAAEAIDQVLRGEHEIEERDRLACWLDGKRLPDATNEVTLQTSRIAKLIQYSIRVEGEHLDTLRGDGVIVSTATGSTGYAMSVGGPLLHPRVKGTVLAPIAPFRLAARPWVVPGDATVELTLMERDSSRLDKPARVVIDGQHGFDVGPGSVVRVAPSDRKARFVRLGSGFYERVRTKLVR